MRHWLSNLLTCLILLLVARLTAFVLDTTPERVVGIFALLIAVEARFQEKAP